MFISTKVQRFPALHFAHPGSSSKMNQLVSSTMNGINRIIQEKQGTDNWCYNCSAQDLEELEYHVFSAYNLVKGVRSGPESWSKINTIFFVEEA